MEHLGDSAVNGIRLKWTLKEAGMKCMQLALDKVEWKTLLNRFSM
jgi:hypothetical protein